jgi:PTH1 family peptidyl-tRNA hydrolase
MKGAFLIVGLGNPGKAYEKTRHNIGYKAVEEIARQLGLTFRKKFLLKGRLAQGVFEDTPVYLLQPETYMNLSGEAVARTMRKFNIETQNLLVIVDDVALPFGQMRLKTHSSAGGHNGLKSIEEMLNTNSYARLRIGVGDQRESDLASYVLAPFTPDEQKLVPEILGRAAMIAKIWLTEGLTSAVNHANVRI